MCAGAESTMQDGCGVCCVPLPMGDAASGPGATVRRIRGHTGGVRLLARAARVARAERRAPAAPRAAQGVWETGAPHSPGAVPGCGAVKVAAMEVRGGNQRKHYVEEKKSKQNFSLRWC